MKNFEKIGLDPAEANEQLYGFELKGNSEDLVKEYEGIFDGIESESFDEMVKAFGEILEDASDEIKEEIMDGNMDVVSEHAHKWGWNTKRIKQFIIFALLTATASPAFASGKEDVFKDLETVQARKSRLHIPQRVVLGKDVVLTPPISTNSSDAQFEKEYKQYSGNIIINGQPGRVIYNDGRRVVLGGEDSVYKRSNDGSEVAIGTVIIE